MRTLARFLCVVLLCLSAAAQDHALHAQAHPVTLVTGLGDLHHPVSTKNPQAQQFFDQGLRFIYAFNHDEAARSFQHAGELDPKLAMAFWGVAEAVGPNYNDPADPDRYKHAHDAVQKAVDLSADASTSDQAYIQALAKRFPADPNSDLKKAAEDYRDAMRQVVSEFPDDLDAATLFAEAGMNLHPWGLWHVDGSSGSDSLLHPCRRGFGLSRAGAGGSEQAGFTRAWRGTHRSHACACLHPHRRLRSCRQDQ